jgi:hypothetical protein
MIQKSINIQTTLLRMRSPSVLFNRVYLRVVFVCLGNLQSEFSFVRGNYPSSCRTDTSSDMSLLGRPPPSNLDVNSGRFHRGLVETCRGKQSQTYPLSLSQVFRLPLRSALNFGQDKKKLGNRPLFQRVLVVIV